MQSERMSNRITTAASAGSRGLPVIIAIMKANPTHPGIAMLACVELLNTLHDLDYEAESRIRAALAMSEFYPLISAALATHGTLPAAVNVIAQAVEVLADDPDSTARAAIVASGILPRLTAALTLHATDIDTLESVVRALALLSASPESADLSSAGAIPPLLTLLTSPIGNARENEILAMAVGQTLANVLMQGSVHAQAVDVCASLEGARAFTQIMAALSTHMRNGDVVCGLSVAMSNIVYGANAGNLRASLPLTEAAELISSGLYMHVNQVRVVMATCFALKSIYSRSTAGTRNIGVTSITATQLTRALSLYLAHTDALTLICGALANMAMSIEGATAVTAAGAVPDVAKALAAHATSANASSIEVVTAATAFITNVANAPDCREALIHAGVARPLVKTLVFHNTNEAVVVAAAYALASLASSEEGKTSVVYAGVIDALETTLVNYGGKPGGHAASGALRVLYGLGLDGAYDDSDSDSDSESLPDQSDSDFYNGDD